MLENVLNGWLLSALVMLTLYLYQCLRDDATIVDVGWSSLLGTLAFYYFIVMEAAGARGWLVLLVCGFWSLRLTIYLFINRVLGKEEDGRYRTIRKNWGNKAWLFFLFFFQAQAVFAVLFSIPVLVAFSNASTDIGVADYLACAIAILSLLGETVADNQLARFRSNPNHRGKTCRTGLWRFSRHPNYFFEWLHWWSYPLFALGTQWWWVALSGPFLMLLFLFRLTGIPYTEAQALQSRGDDYRRYQQATSVFIPWFPKKENS